MERTLWVVGLLLFWAVLIYLMYRGWQNRAQRQAARIGELPPVPQELGAQVLEPTTGLYLGSTMAPSWQDRIAVGDLGFRATAELTRFERGILLERDGAAVIWIPQESITAVRTERGHAGKVMTEDGVLVIRWKLPTGTEIDTGFRGDDKTVYPAWARVTTGDEG
ncbi:transporter [Nocardia cyriacigeorgica]|uniref:Transporter n=1 Tax=Nocardia cyriacigeorgica TaxID=135487 RepID=A0A6P1CYS9_9NOCA|nr:transporter [Nocardia cyriacigeorgica]NEW40489.1 transporter [Nocardia cyriacigeorgica]NEW43058.1 transporter [Nocardia cyriacigeorgica]NEW51716.1 transporter [Nocardia cyriacigeorgica]NEW55526.1 transporter [Nocardia cyriacigeorgica]